MRDDAGPSLRELQRQLFALIRAPGGVGDGLERLGLDEDALDAVVDGDDRLSAAGRVGIYADMYFLRLLDVLRGAFPKLAVALGDDAFAALAAEYLEAHPSRHPSLRHLGDRLPAFMREQGGALPPWAADLAALEWQRYDVFDEADAPLLTMERLRALPPTAFATLPIRLVPACRVLPAGFAVEEVWRALKADEAPPDMPAQDRTLLVWRQDTSVYHRAVEALEAELLPLARAGTTLGLLCERVAAQLEGDTAAQAVFRIVARWTSDGLLVEPSERHPGLNVPP